jgi:hypothetical protein
MLMPLAYFVDPVFVYTLGETSDVQALVQTASCMLGVRR